MMENRKIEMHYSFELAVKVLRKVEGLISQDEADRINCRLFANCREQGFSLTNHSCWRQVAFAMNRWGGGVVVYHGNIDQFNISTNHPETDELWEQCKYYGDEDASPIDIADAAEFIIQWLFKREELEQNG
jgi:hypothetical protein